MEMLNLKVIISPDKKIKLEGYFTPESDGLLSTSCSWCCRQHILSLWRPPISQWPYSNTISPHFGYGNCPNFSLDQSATRTAHDLGTSIKANRAAFLTQGIPKKAKTK